MTVTLLTGIGSNVALGILAGLRKDKDIKIIGTSNEDLCAGYFLVDKAYQVPRYDSEGYLNTFTEILNEENIDYVFPGVDFELPFLASNKETIESETNAKIIISDSEFIDMSQDKSKTPIMLKRMGLPYPKTWVAETNHPDCISEYPVVAKPRIGQASRGYQLIKSKHEMEHFISSTSLLNKYCFQEYLDGPEYTCGLLFDSVGKYCDSIIMERQLDQTGTSIIARIVEQHQIQQFLDEFGRQAEGAIGSINVQLRLVGGTPYVFEINPRFSGTTSFRVRAGYNDPLRVLLNFAQGTPITRTKVKERYYLRYLTEIEVYSEKINEVLRIITNEP